jgi:hypothetical protein
MAPFIVNHPTLLNNWVMARETALKNIRQIKRGFHSPFFVFKTKPSLLNCLGAIAPC